MKSNTRTMKLKIQKVSGSIQIIELCLILILVVTQIPEPFKNSGVFFQNLCKIVTSPRSVFLIGNAIVIVLLAKSGHFQAQDPTQEGSSTDLYNEFTEQSQKNHHSRRSEIEKQIKTEEHRYTITSCDDMKCKIQRTQSVDLNLDCMNRSGSESKRSSESDDCKKIVATVDLKLDGIEKSRRVLRRSVTEFREENMSNKEFKSKIEAFIARQQRMRRGETECSVF